MKPCPDRIMQLHALIDGELDATNAAAIELHVEECPGCAGEIAEIETLRSALSAAAIRHPAPAALRQRIDTALAVEKAPWRQSRPPIWRRPWVASGAAMALAASLMLIFVAPQSMTMRVQDQIVASHVRSLLVDHVADIATSDQHVVKPWFNGRIDFAPPVIELADAGFPLAGGRLDYIDGRVVPAVVYKRRLHVINLFAWPAGSVEIPMRVAAIRDGYSLIGWRHDGMIFWAVSDISPDELAGFRRAWLQHQSKPGVIDH
jgi:anti-sigma factor RsiW